MPERYYCISCARRVPPLHQPDKHVVCAICGGTAVKLDDSQDVNVSDTREELYCSACKRDVILVYPGKLRVPKTPAYCTHCGYTLYRRGTHGIPLVETYYCPCGKKITPDGNPPYISPCCGEYGLTLTELELWNSRAFPSTQPAAHEMLDNVTSVVWAPDDKAPQFPEFQVSRLTVGPDETLLVSVSGQPDNDTLERISEVVRAELPSDARVLVHGDALQFSVVRTYHSVMDKALPDLGIRAPDVGTPPRWRNFMDSLSLATRMGS